MAIRNIVKEGDPILNKVWAQLLPYIYHQRRHTMD